MSVATIFWGIVGALVLGEVLNAFRRRQWRQIDREFAAVLRDLADDMSRQVLLVEDLIRIESEREEALSITRLDMVTRQVKARKLANKLEKRATKKRGWR